MSLVRRIYDWLWREGGAISAPPAHYGDGLYPDVLSPRQQHEGNNELIAAKEAAAAEFFIRQTEKNRKAQNGGNE